MILSAQSIRELAPMISPFWERTVHNGKTFGLSAAGYDVRVEFDEGIKAMLLSPGSFRLASTMEKFTMPAEVMGIVHDKSSWARRGLTVQNTVIEPGWTGFLTLELTNHGRDSLHLVKGDPIAQIVFHWLDRPTEQPYDGKYQNQKPGPQPVIVESS